MVDSGLYGILNCWQHLVGDYRYLYLNLRFDQSIVLISEHSLFNLLLILGLVHISEFWDWIYYGRLL